MTKAARAVAKRTQKIASYVVGFIRGGTPAKFIKNNFRPDSFDAAAFSKACFEAAKKPKQGPENCKRLIKAAGDFGNMVE